MTSSLIRRPPFTSSYRYLKLQSFHSRLNCFYIQAFFVFFFSSKEVRGKRLCSRSINSPQFFNPLSLKSKQYFIYLKNNNTLPHLPVEQLGTGLLFFEASFELQSSRNNITSLLVLKEWKVKSMGFGVTFYSRESSKVEKQRQNKQ